MWVYWGAVHWCHGRGLNLQQLIENFRAGLNSRATGCFQTAKQLLLNSVCERRVSLQSGASAKFVMFKASSKLV
jgi:hypothetical protein